MNILTLNAGSSSLKYQFFQNELSLLSGLIENIGEANGEYQNHGEALQAVNAHLNTELGNIACDAVAHRVVHGGNTFSKPTEITQANLDALKALPPLAPLHNPANILGIETAMKAYPNAKHIAIFDTAFHATLPASAYTYAIDQTLAAEKHIRRYGFHGTSHQFVSEAAAKLLGKPLAQCELISAHLGNGASMAAIQRGQSINTSMGMTPTAGLCMGTRSGDLDPAVVSLLAKEYSATELDTLLNKQSGLKGICGDNDMRTIESRAAKGDSRAQLAIDVFVTRIQQYIGAYLTQLPNCDALIFTGGIGENSSTIRKCVCEKLSHLGFKLEDAQNEIREKDPRIVSLVNSPIMICVIPTNEELQMVRLCQGLL